jgi:RNA polymerase sigma-70 factor (ECF subfamily)
MPELELVSDVDLVKQMVAGSEEAFMTLYTRKQGSIYRFALQMSGSVAAAEDITQDVFLTLLRVAGSFDQERGSLGAFLYGIARNLLLKRFEIERNYIPISNEDQDGEAQEDPRLVTNFDPLGDLVRAEAIDRVRKAITTLPPHYREMVVLCDLHEMSYAQAAAIVGCRVGTVRSRLHRARSILLERLVPRQVRDDENKKPKEAFLGYSV